MKTRYIRYEQLKSLSGFNHIKVAKEVELEDGDNETVSMDMLRGSVHVELGISADQLTLRDDIERLRDQKARLDGDIAYLDGDIAYRRQELERLRGLVAKIEDLSIKLEQSGVEIPEGLLLDIPF